MSAIIEHSEFDSNYESGAKKVRRTRPIESQEDFESVDDHQGGREHFSMYFPVESKGMDTAIKLYERVDKKKLRLLVNNNYIDSNLKKKLKAYLKHNRVQENLFKVEYTFSKYAYLESRRLFCRTGSGIQSFPGDVRSFPSAQFVDNIDQVNSAPTIVQYLLKKYAISCPELDEYINSCAAALQREGLTKRKVISALYNKRTPYNCFLKKIQYCVYESLVPILKSGDNYWSQYWQHVKHLKQNEVKDNIEGALVMQTLENQCLTAMREFFKQKKFEVNSLIFDGLTITTPKLFDTKDETGLKIPLAMKPMTLSDHFYDEYHIDKYQKEDVDVDSEDEKPKDVDWSFINEFEGWEDFDYKAFFNPTHISMARWFLWLKTSIIKKHSSSIVWVLGRNNIWQMAQDIHKTDLRLQICDAIMASAEKLVSNVAEYDPKAVEAMNFQLFKLRGDCEDANYLKSVAEIVYIACPESERCIEDFLSNPHIRVGGYGEILVMY
ncbi:hypothetical protein HK104_005180 [Borealophlyctis nickersoniae]|nr:hypothetical protein HK104_005180 [Borealophlyctis nickersoniae]